jgi:hypothetical protein
MVTDKRGEAAAGDIEAWANRVIHPLDARAEASVYHDPDSSTYIVRLARGSRVLVFRFSEAQVYASEREAECEKTLKSKLKNL